MSSEQQQFTELAASEADEFPFVDGELLETSPNETAEKKLAPEADKQIVTAEIKNRNSPNNNQKSFLQYIALPLIFLTTALLGGVRVDSADAAFVFLKPPLVCLIFAAILLVLFVRARLLKLDGWFSENFAPTKNVANAVVWFALFLASTQIFNSLLPEKGLPFWVVAFCFFWTLWNNLFAAFDTKRLVQSLGGMFGLAFVVKYLLLAGLTAPTNKSWIQGVFENPAQETFTWLLDLPRFAAATGYLQFFALGFYLLGLFLLKPETNE